MVPHLLLALQIFFLPTCTYSQTNTVSQVNYCCICKQESTFKPGGTKKNRPHALCPSCQSLERHRTLYLYLNQKTDLFNTNSPLKLLQFSPNKSEQNAFKRELSKNIEYITTDLEGPTTLHLDITNIDLPDNSIDIIICYHVLEHVRDDNKAIKELLRIIKTNGFAIIQVPLHPVNQFTMENPNATEEERIKLYGQADHVRYYGQKDFENRLTKAGCLFTEVMTDFLASFNENEKKRLGLAHDKTYILTK